VTQILARFVPRFNSITALSLPNYSESFITTAAAVTVPRTLANQWRRQDFETLEHGVRVHEIRKKSQKFIVNPLMGH